MYARGMEDNGVGYELTNDHKARYYIGDTFVGWRWLDSQFVLCALCHTKYLTLIESVDQHFRNNHKEVATE